MSDIAAPSASSSWGSIATDSSSSDAGWTVGPMYDSNPPSQEYTATIDGRSHVLRASSEGIGLKIGNGPERYLPNARVVMDGGNPMISVGGKLLTVEQAFGLSPTDVEPGSGGATPAPGDPQPPHGGVRSVPPVPGTGSGAEPTNHEAPPQTVPAPQALW